MFLKLLRHEFKANAATYLILYGVCLTISVIVRFSVPVISTQLLNDSTVQLEYFLHVSLLWMLFLTMFIVGVYIFFFAVVMISFNKSMYKKPGYLTLTLPISTNQLILSKLIGSLIWFCLTGIILYISTLIMFSQYSLVIDVILLTFQDQSAFAWFVLVCMQFLVHGIKYILMIFLVVTAVNTKAIKSHRKMIGTLLFIIFVWIINFIQNNLTESTISYFSSNRSFPLVNSIQTINEYIIDGFIPSITIPVLVSIFCFFMIRYFLKNKIELD